MHAQSVQWLNSDTRWLKIYLNYIPNMDMKNKINSQSTNSANSAQFALSLIPRTDKEPREQLVRDNADGRAVIHSLTIDISHIETVHPHVQKAPEYAHVHAEDESEPHLVAFLLLVEEPNHGSHITSACIEPGVKSTHIQSDCIEPGV